MRQSAVWCLAAGLAVMATGCSRQPSSPCEPVERYSTATSAPPIQIPDDLSPPSDADALRLPQVAATNTSPGDRCLESPPPFSTNGRAGRERAAEPAPAEAQPAVESTDPDRVIDN